MKNHGQVMVLALIFLAVLLILASILFGGILSFLFGSRVSYAREKALQLAEAGVDKAIFELNQTAGSYLGETGSKICSSCEGEFSVSITSESSNLKTIESIGYFPNSTNSEGKRKVKVKAEITTTTVSFFYAVQADFGGLEMANSSRIEGVGGAAGNVYSNGSIVGANSASITGDVWVAGGTALTPDVEHTNQTLDFIFRNTKSRRDASQSFIPASTNVINKIQLYLKKVGNPSNASIHIVSDNSGLPDSTPLTSGSLNSSLVTTNYGWIDVTFSSNPQLSSGQKYWIVIDNNSYSPSNYWVWGAADNTSYPQGEALYASNYSSGSWSSENKDANFKIFVGGVDTFVNDVDVGGDTHAHTITDSTVGKDAYYQEISGTIVSGNSFPGSADPPPKNMPISQSNINEWKQEAEAGGVISGDYIVTESSSQSLGPKKITGDMTIENSGTLTVTGTIYVVGDIYLQNSCVVRLDPTFGSSSAVIVADGRIILDNSCTVLGSGNSNSYILFLSTSPANTSETPAIDLSNSATGGIFYAASGAVKLGNSVTLKMVSGNKIILSNSVTIQYESGLESTSFSSGPGGSWQVKSRTWQLLPI